MTAEVSPPRQEDDVIPFFVTLLRFFDAVRNSLKDPDFQALSFLVAVTLLSGTFFYWRIEDWSLLDSLYFSVMTLTTVGYGDLVPTTALGKLFTIFYVFVGVGLIAAFLGKIASRSVEIRASRRSRRSETPGGPPTFPENAPNEPREEDPT